MIKHPLAYLPFSALIIAGFLLRLAAFAASDARRTDQRCQADHHPAFTFRARARGDLAHPIEIPTIF